MRKLLLSIVISLICAGLSCILSGCSVITDYRSGRIHKFFDAAVEEIDRIPTSELDVWNYGPVRNFKDNVDGYRRTNADEIDILTKYLTAYGGSRCPWGGSLRVYALEDQWESLKDIPVSYSGYYSEKILEMREHVKALYEELEKAKAAAPKCLVEGCSEPGDIEIDLHDNIEIFSYCHYHKCSTIGCGNARYTKLYCLEHSPSSLICREDGCNNLVDPDTPGAKYCKRHKCAEKGCPDGVWTNQSNGYCMEHYRKHQGSASGKTTSPKSYSQGKSKEKKSSSGNDPFDVDYFDDPDDFADEWAEEFGDGDFEDGWDDAWDYWQENQ